MSLVLATSPASPLQWSDEAVKGSGGLRDRGRVAAAGVESQVLDSRAPPTGTRLQRAASKVEVEPRLDVEAEAGRELAERLKGGPR